MEKISLLFGIHIHQPVDNFGSTVDEAMKLCYQPFFETMVKYPEFKFAVHCSGWLLNEIRVKYPSVFKDMQFLTKKGAIQWMSAGYYEPVLSAIPSKDRKGQIKKLNSFIKKYFNVQPTGLWLTERVWESSLIPDIVSCGIDHVIVDDYHFLSSGFDQKKLDGYYTTEESGIDLNLFPIAQSLRYALPFFSVEKAIDSVLAAAKDENSAAIIFDDGEKFGLWPKTYEWVYEKKWLEGFIQTVLANEAIEPLHYDTYLQQHHSLGVAYLNNTSYFEMGEWSLQPEQTLAMEELKQNVGNEYFDKYGVSFIKGGIWKNFFIKYTESNYLHKRMLYFSLKQNNLKKTDLEFLYKLQTNDVFWHGVFGGLYLPNLRDNAYKYLLTLEKSMAKESICYEVLDIDKDGYEELKVLTQDISFVFSTKYGGSMVEFGSLTSFFNWQNSLTRRKEAYHDKILYPEKYFIEQQQSKEEIATIHNDRAVVDEQLQSELIYDWYHKYSFIDHISNSPFTLQNFKKLTFQEVGDFANQPFELSESSHSFVRNGGIYLDKKYDTTIQKDFTFTNNMVMMQLQCKSTFAGELFYGQEFNLHFAHPYKTTFNGKTLEDDLSFFDCDELVIYDHFTKETLQFKIDQKTTIFTSIVYTISQSESGFDKVVQGISIIFTTPFLSTLDFNITLGVH